MKKLLFFLNPNAGHTEIRNSLLEVLQIFTNGGYDVTVHPTSAPRDLTEKIVREGAGYDLIVCAGGDGTLNEAVSGLMQMDNPPPLGYIPGGTVNDVASTLGLSHDPITAAQDIIGGREFCMDVGQFGKDRWFLYVAAFGLFTEVPYETPQEDKRVLGRVAYLLAGVKTLADVHPVHTRIVCGDEVLEEDVLDGLVCSTTSVGGFKINQPDLGISLNDGLSELVVVKNIKNLLDFNKVATELLRRDLQGDALIWRQVRRVQFFFDEPVKWTLDGEFGGAHKDVEIQIHKQALKILVPK